MKFSKCGLEKNIIIGCLRSKIHRNFEQLSTFLACGILVPQPGVKSVPPALKAQSPNCWTTGKFP